MNYEEMQSLQEQVFERIRKLRETKGREYAADADTLADFKEVAAESGVTPLQAWAVYVKKHQRAIDTFIREGDVKSESIESRIHDVLTYHILLLGLIEDDRRAGLDGEAIAARGSGSWSPLEPRTWQDRPPSPPGTPEMNPYAPGP